MPHASQMELPNATETRSERGQVELSIVMPCLDEAETVVTCIRKAQASLSRLGVIGEVIIADNGSTDGSQRLAEEAGARVVHEQAKGYGNALMGGIRAARGRYVIMGDADDSYDFSNLGPFLEQLRAGYELVMGNRFLGGILPGAMPPLHRYFGNPVLTGVARLMFWHPPCRDFHCGLRGFSREAILGLDLRTSGMEFASEMIVKAVLRKLRVVEVPTTLSPDGRFRPPHLRSFRDGWRHLRFLLLYSPRWLFLYPGLALMFAGIAAGAWLLTGPKLVGSVWLDIHTLLYAALAVIVGFQTVVFAVSSKVFAVSAGLLPEDARLERMLGRFGLETGLVVGAALTLIGIASSASALGQWEEAGFGALDASQTMRAVILSVTSLALGFQTVLASFFLSVLGLARR